MSIRFVAQDLYRLVREVDSLEKALRTAPPEKKPELQEQLRKTKAERERLRRALEGHKNSR